MRVKRLWRPRIRLRELLIYLLKTGEAYLEERAKKYECTRGERELKHLSRRGQKLGNSLTTMPAGAVSIERIP